MLVHGVSKSVWVIYCRSRCDSTRPFRGSSRKALCVLLPYDLISLSLKHCIIFWRFKIHLNWPSLCVWQVVLGNRSSLVSIACRVDSTFFFWIREKLWIRPDWELRRKKNALQNSNSRTSAFVVIYSVLLMVVRIAVRFESFQLLSSTFFSGRILLRIVVETFNCCSERLLFSNVANSFELVSAVGMVRNRIHQSS